jgi:hypothetical protein
MGLWGYDALGYHLVNISPHATDPDRPTDPYLAWRRTTGPVMLHAFPFASVPLKFDCAVWADADTLHQRVRIVVDPFAAMRRPGFVGAELAPSNESVRWVTVTAAPPTSFRT